MFNARTSHPLTSPSGNIASEGRLFNRINTQLNESQYG